MVMNQRFMIFQVHVGNNISKFIKLNIYDLFFEKIFLSLLNPFPPKNESKNQTSRKMKIIWKNFFQKIARIFLKQFLKILKKKFFAENLSTKFVQKS